MFEYNTYKKMSVPFSFKIKFLSERGVYHA